MFNCQPVQLDNRYRSTLPQVAVAPRLEVVVVEDRLLALPTVQLGLLDQLMELQLSEVVVVEVEALAGAAGEEVPLRPEASNRFKRLDVRRTGRNFGPIR